MDLITSSKRRTRFVCISDTHNASPRDGCFKLPPGDVLIHAGDLTNQGTYRELKRTIEWIAGSDYEVKIVVAGNHDVTLDQKFYSEHGQKLHERYPQDQQACIDLIAKHPDIVYLNHESKVIRLNKADGPRTTFKVFGSPYSPRSGLWAFNYEPLSGLGADAVSEATEMWEAIPSDSDVVITHTPPRGSCDAGQNRSCEGLRRAHARVRPILAVCGHIHEGWGAETVTWHFEDDQVGWTQGSKQTIELERTSKRLAKIDLTLKNRGVVGALDNKLSISRRRPATKDTKEENSDGSDRMNATPEAIDWMSGSHSRRQQCDGGTGPRQLTAFNQDPSMVASVMANLGDQHGTNPGSTEALLSSEHSEFSETCIVNAAIMGKSRHARGSGGPWYNKAIVVDIDLVTTSSE